jgi:NADH-quinone oxidoreductase subunit N
MPLELPTDLRFLAIGPELALLGAALLTLVLDAFVRDRTGARWYLPVLSTLGLVTAIALAVVAWGENDLVFADAIALDGFATFCKIALAGFGVLTVWLGRDYLVRDGIEESEFYALVLFAVAGMMLMASAADLIVIFLALETFSIALYVLVGYRRRSVEGQESAMKYSSTRTPLRVTGCWSSPRDS